MFNPLGFASTSVLQALGSDGCYCVCAGFECTSIVVITVMVTVGMEIGLSLSLS
jgi:hypothetical protein